MSETREAPPIVPYADPDVLEGPLKDAVAAYTDRMGFLPNALRLYIHRPELLECLIRLNNTVMRDPSSTLDAGLKRRIAAVCSAVNKSAYCVAHNTNTLTTASDGGGEGWDFDADDVAALLDDRYEPQDEMERACFAYARTASDDPTAVPEALLRRLTELMTPPQIVELACLVGFWKMYNAIHESLHVPIEEALLDQG